MKKNDYIKKQKNDTATLSLSSASNLRRDPLRPEVWRRVGAPRALATSGALPLAEISLPEAGGRKALLLAAGRALYASAATSAAADPLAADRFFLGMLGGEALEADTSVSGVVKIRCRRAASEYVTYTSSGVFTLRGPLPRLPQLSIHAAQASTRYADTLPVKLTGATRSRDDSAIADYDLSIITPKLLFYYNCLKLGVKNAGAAMQPVLARYRLRDSFGETVHISAPVLLCAPSGFQMAREFTFSSPDALGSVSAGFVQCDSYFLAVNAPESLPAPWDSIVASAEIEVSPQLDPVDPEGICAGTFKSSGGGTALATFHYPGINPVLSARQAALRTLVVSALARAERILAPVAKIGRPFGGTLGAPGSDKKISMPERYIGADELAALPATTAALAGKTYTASLPLDGLSLRATPSRPVPPPMEAAAFGAAFSSAEGAWKGAVSVSLSGKAVRETRVAESSASCSCPTAFGPLLVHPDPDAVELTLAVERPDGSAVTRTFPLTPLPEAGISYWIDPAIARVTLPQAQFGFEVPLESFTERPPEQVVEVFAGSDDAPADRAALDFDVLAMADAPRASSSWDFSRRRVLCFGAGGSVMLNIDSKGSVRSGTVIDGRPVASPQAVTRASGPGGAALLTVAGGDLLRISGSKVETILHSCRAERPGWCGKFREIWLFGGETPPRRLTPDGELVGTALPGIGADAVCSLWNGRLLVSSGGRLFDASDELPADSLPFSIAFETAVRGRPRRLTADMAASALTGGLSLAGHDGSEIFGPLASFCIDGPLNAPLRLPLVAPARRFLKVAASGTASPDLSVRTLTIEF
ncbi:MAG: hypothetical protein K2G30_06250 [Muribaculaceae bacterium]|nr:hypothetical protein [Muribaculaceae bacterium]